MYGLGDHVVGVAVEGRTVRWSKPGVVDGGEVLQFMEEGVKVGCIFGEKGGGGIGWGGEFAGSAGGGGVVGRGLTVGVTRWAVAA